MHFNIKHLEWMDTLHIKEKYYFKNYLVGTFKIIAYEIFLELYRQIQNKYENMFINLKQSEGKECSVA